MSQTIDERIVAMHFDNDQFEKGARQSLKTLEELKKGLDLEGVGESFEQVSKATENGLGLKTATKETNLFSTAMKKLGTVATAPLRALTNGFSNLSGYIQKVIGFDLASKLVSAGEQVIRAFTIDPLRTGWQEYELKMDSIKTIMSGTAEEFRKTMGDDYSQEEHLEIVKEKLEELNKYADDTIYSFSDMTSNIGKFTNNGVKLNDAVAAMMGISNAAAQAGQGTQQASMAMYNLSQAIGVGKLTTIDWKSIENANMATLQFKQTFMDVGVALGKLKKEGDQYFTTTNKKMEVTAENFRNTLSEGWADKDVLVATLAAYSGNYTAKELSETYAISQELALQLVNLGQEAKQAAMEVRTFSKMWDALKEAAQSGWALSFEYLFGDMNEATNMWTMLNDRFSALLDATAERRNDLLKEWRGIVSSKDVSNITELVRAAVGGDFQETYGMESWWDAEKSIASLTEEILDYYQKNGTGPEAVQSLIDFLGDKYSLQLQDAERITQMIRESYEGLGYAGDDKRETLLQGVNALLDGFGNVITLFKRVKAAVFGETTADSVRSLTDRFAKAATVFRDFTGSLLEGTTFEYLKTALGGVVKVLGSFWNTVKSAGSLVLKTFAPAGEWLLGLFARIGSWLSNNAGKNLVEFFTNIGKSLKNLKLGKAVQTTLSSLGGLFAQMGKNAVTWLKTNGLNGVADFLSNGWATIRGVWEKVSAWKGWAAIGDFVNDAFGWIAQTFGTAKTTATAQAKNGANALSQLIRKGWNELKTVWSAVSKWSGWQAIGSFFTDVWGWIKRQFKGGKEPDGKEGEDGSSPVTAWLEATKTNIENFWNKNIAGLDIWQKVASFFTDIWGWIVSQFSGKSDDDNAGDGKKDGSSPVTKWLDDTKKTIEDFWNTFVTWDVWEKLGSFFTDIWGWIISQFSGKSDDDNAGGGNNEKDGSSPVTKWLDATKRSIEEAWVNISGWSGWSQIGQFITDIWGWIIDTFGRVKTAWSGNTPSPTQGDSTLQESLAEENTLVESTIEEASKLAENVSVLGRLLDFLIPSAHAEDVLPDEAMLAEALPIQEKNLTLLERISGVIGVVFSAISDLIRAIGDGLATVGDQLGLTAYINMFKAVGEFVTTLMEVLAKVITHLANLGSGILSGDATAIVEGIGLVVVGVLTAIGKYKWSKAMAEFGGNYDSIGSQLMKIAGAVLMISVAISLLGSLDAKTLLIGGVAAIALLAIVSKIATAINEHATITAGLEMSDSAKIATTIIKWVGIMGSIAAALALLPGVIEAIGKNNVSGDDLLKVMEGLTILLGGVILISAVSEKLAGHKTATDSDIARQLITTLTVVGAIAAAMALMPGIIRAMGEADIRDGKAIFEALSGLTVLIAGVSAVIGAVSAMNIRPESIVKTAFGLSAGLGIFLLVVTAFLQGVGGLVNLAGGTIDADPFDGLVTLIEGVGKVWNAIKDVFGKKQVSTEDQLVGVGQAMAEIAEEMEDVSTADMEKLKDSFALVNQIADMAENLDADRVYRMNYSKLEEELVHLATATHAFAVEATRFANDDSIDLNAIEAFGNSLVSLLTAANLWTLLDNFSLDNFSWATFAAGLQEMTGTIGVGATEGYDHLIESFARLSSFAEIVNASIAEAVPNINVSPLIGAIAEGITGPDAESRLQLAFAQLAAELAENGTSLLDFGGGSILETLLGGLSDSGVGSGISGLLSSFTTGLDGVSFEKFGVEDFFSFGTNDLNEQIAASFNAEEIKSLISGENGEGLLSFTDLIGNNSDWKASAETMVASLQEQLDNGDYSLSISAIPDLSSEDFSLAGESIEIHGSVSLQGDDIAAITNTIVAHMDTGTNRIVSAVNSLGGRISAVEAAIRNMSIVLDTGAVAGAVNNELGRQLRQSSRTMFFANSL